MALNTSGAGKINFKASRQDYLIADRIVRRMEHMAREHGVKRFDRLNHFMDIIACHANGCQLKMQELLDADDFTFAHDTFGITRHMDRNTGKLTDCFLPRTAEVCHGQTAA